MYFRFHAKNRYSAEKKCVHMCSQRDKRYHLHKDDKEKEKGKEWINQDCLSYRNKDM